MIPLRDVRDRDSIVWFLVFLFVPDRRLARSGLILDELCDLSDCITRIVVESGRSGLVHHRLATLSIQSIEILTNGSAALGWVAEERVIALGDIGITPLAKLRILV